MEQRSVDLLIADIAEIINVSDPERLRAQVVDLVRYALRDIGIEHICTPYVEPMAIKSHRIVLPSYVQKVDDGGWTEAGGEFYKVPFDSFPKEPLAYWETKMPYSLHFPNRHTDTVFVKFWSLPLDEQKQPLIPFDAYRACYLYCLARVLETKPRNILFSQGPYYAEQARIEIGNVKANTVKESAASRRAVRQYMGIGTPRTGRHQIIADTIF